MIDLFDKNILKAEKPILKEIKRLEKLKKPTPLESRTLKEKKAKLKEDRDTHNAKKKADKAILKGDKR